MKSNQTVLQQGFQSKVVVVKNPLLKSNLLQLKEIAAYHYRNPHLTINDAAIKWIDQNAGQWRKKHPLAL